MCFHVMHVTKEEGYMSALQKYMHYAAQMG
jgi:hypothetical protein